jgi:hypothetical protein
MLKETPSNTSEQRSATASTVTTLTSRVPAEAASKHATTQNNTSKTTPHHAETAPFTRAFPKVSDLRDSKSDNRNGAEQTAQHTLRTIIDSRGYLHRI